MGIEPAPLSSWPWEKIGNLKYFLFAPLVLQAIHGRYTGVPDMNNWYLQILLISSLRYIQSNAWISISRSYWAVKTRQISMFGTNYDQVDREYNCDNHIIFQALMSMAAYGWFPNIRNLPVWNLQGIIALFILHTAVVESLYYLIHRVLHTEPFFSQYHSLHHASTAVETSTAGTRTFLEELLQCGLMVLAFFGASILGGLSLSLFYIYLLGFDFLKQMGHCNFEFVPKRAFQIFPLLKFFLYTPSYHSLHHMDCNSNFCLFMPFYDYLGGTKNQNTDALYESLVKEGRKEEVPCFVFLAHAVDVVSSLHVSFANRTFSSVPYTNRWFLPLLWPIGFVAFCGIWVWGKTFVAYEYFLRGLHAQTWIVPRYGLHYFLPFGLDSINKHIEQAILDADAKGVKVISLAALNKNESLNGGGKLFVKRLPNVKVRVVHGNTLTAAAIIHEIPQTVSEIFLTGATSKLGRALALYLCKKGMRVLMLTSSRDRYDSIVREAPADCQKLLVQVTKYQAGRNCKTWVLGKWATESDQKWAPVGTHFHQFVVPPVHPFRKDCTYGKLIGIRLPKDITGMKTCEYNFERGVVAACHAGGLLHALENWDYHEVGTIDVDKIDMVWEAAIRHGFTPV